MAGQEAPVEPAVAEAVVALLPVTEQGPAAEQILERGPVAEQILGREPADSGRASEPRDAGTDLFFRPHGGGRNPSGGTYAPYPGRDVCVL